MYVRTERTIVLTDRGRAVLALIRQQDVLPVDDEAGRAAIERQIGELLDGCSVES